MFLSVTYNKTPVEIEIDTVGSKINKNINYVRKHNAQRTPEQLISSIWNMLDIPFVPQLKFLDFMRIAEA